VTWLRSAWGWIAALVVALLAGVGLVTWWRARKGRPDPLEKDLRDELDQLADDHVSAVEASGKAEVAATRQKAREHVAAQLAALEEHANAPVNDDPADWARPGRRDDD